MGSKFTRRRFLAAVGVGATYLALTNTVGCGLRERTTKTRSLHTPTVRPLPGVSSAPPTGVRAFRSRPDLGPPAVEVATQAHDTAPGYTFIAPEEGGAAQGGSMIIDDRGEVVWFRPLQGTSGRAMNFEVQNYRGRPVLTWGETPGEYVIFDSSYREITRLHAGNGYNGDHHEFLISPQDTALITIYNAVRRDLSPVGGDKDGVEGQEIPRDSDTKTGKGPSSGQS